MDLNKIKLLIILSVFSAYISGCSALEFLSASFKSTDSFVISETNSQVRYKGSNKEYANKIGLILPGLISMVEKNISVNFINTPIIFICDTWRCMEEYTGHSFKPRAAANKRGIFISPKLIGEIKATTKILPHEITHVLSVENINSLFQSVPPAWFDEGLATFISNGGGAEKISRKQAINSIKNGKYFVPNNDGKMFSKMYGDKWNLDPHMFYRQSMLFVEYLYDKDPEIFKIFVSEVFSGKKKFSDLFLKYYKYPPATIWSNYRYKML